MPAACRALEPRPTKEVENEDDDEDEDDFCGAVDVSARSATSPLASKTPELGRTSRSRQRS
jgi:hypothetical protein